MTSAIELIDSHCHFDFSAFDEDRQGLWDQCRQQGIRQMIIPGVAPAQWSGAAAISRALRGIYCAAGIHPWWVDQTCPKPLQTSDLEALHIPLMESVADPACVAVGECGLDKHCDVDFGRQLQVFEWHLAMADACDKPLIIHCVKAHNEVIRALKHHRPRRGGVIHAFSGSPDLAHTYWSLGFCLGVGGTITFQRAQKTRRAVADAPAQALLLETDAPDMPLSGRQGQRNSPLYLPEVAEVLARLRGVPLPEIARQTRANTVSLFGLQEEDKTSVC